MERRGFGGAVFREIVFEPLLRIGFEMRDAFLPLYLAFGTVNLHVGDELAVVFLPFLEQLLVRGFAYLGHIRDRI